MYGPIIFSAHNNPGTAFSAGAYITGFAEFLTNVGDSFTLYNGIFEAPRNGIYEFSTSYYHWDANHDILAVVKNGAQVLKFVDTSNANYKSDWTLTFNWIMELQKGDKVRLQVVVGTFYCGRRGDDVGHYSCIFNGKLLQTFN